MKFYTGVYTYSWSLVWEDCLSCCLEPGKRQQKQLRPWGLYIFADSFNLPSREHPSVFFFFSQKTLSGLVWRMKILLRDCEWRAWLDPRMLWPWPSSPSCLWWHSACFSDQFLFFHPLRSESVHSSHAENLSYPPSSFPYSARLPLLQVIHKVCPSLTKCWLVIPLNHRDHGNDCYLHQISRTFDTQWRALRQRLEDWGIDTAEETKLPLWSAVGVNRHCVNNLHRPLLHQDSLKQCIPRVASMPQPSPFPQ